MPAIVAAQPDVPVLVTDATASLLSTMCFDSAKVLSRRSQEHQVDNGGAAPLPPYMRDDVKRALDRLDVIGFGQHRRVGDLTLRGDPWRMSRIEVLTDEMWARIEPLLPPLEGAMGQPCPPYRPLVEGAIYRLRTGMAWRDLPREFGPWQTVWKRHDEFAHDGTWDKVLAALQSHADAAGQINGKCSAGPAASSANGCRRGGRSRSPCACASVMEAAR